MRCITDNKPSLQNVPYLARSRGNSLSTLALGYPDIDEFWWGSMAVRTLLASFASSFDSTGSAVFISSRTIDQLRYSKDLNQGLITSLGLLAFQSEFPNFGPCARNPSTAYGWPDENPMTSSSDFLTEHIRGTRSLDGQADDAGSIFTASRRRSRTQIFDARDHGESIFGGALRWPHDRRFRSIEESIPTPQTGARRYMQPVRAHVVQRWKRFRRKPRSDSPTPTMGRSFSLRLSSSGHRSRIQSTLDTELASNDNAGPVGIHTRRRPETHRIHSAPVVPQHLVSGLPGETLSAATRSAPLAPMHHDTLNDDGESTASNESTFEDGASYFALGEQRAERSLRTKSSSACLLRVSTAGTTVFSPPIIAEARPNAKKLDHSGNTYVSSSESSGGGADELSFL